MLTQAHVNTGHIIPHVVLHDKIVSQHLTWLSVAVALCCYKQHGSCGFLELGRVVSVQVR